MATDLRQIENDMDVWVLECGDYECCCHVIFDHAPSDEEIGATLLCGDKSFRRMLKTRLREILNKNIGSLI